MDPSQVHDLTERAERWARVDALIDAGTPIDQVLEKESWLKKKYPATPPVHDTDKTPASDTDPLNQDVLDLLQDVTGCGDRTSWNNIWLLVSKGEHDNTDPKKAFKTDKNTNVFTYASALSYDWKKRGVTMGLVGWTTANNGQDGRGDAPELFKAYKALGGEDLMKYCDGCTKSRDTCDKLIKKITSLDNDAAWTLAQWQQLCLTQGGYLYQVMKTFKKIGIPKPSPLAIATVLDASLNQGFDGPDGGCVCLEKLGVSGDENATLEKYNAWRRKVAGTNDYNSPPINGQHRADQFEILRKSKQFDLQDTKAVVKAISWEMK